jgi:hypothetical protein
MALAAIIAAVAVTAIGFAIPQQVLAGGHHHNDGIKVNSQISQLNNCTGPAPPDSEDEEAGAEENAAAEEVSSPTVCLNIGTNTADISR